MELYEQIRREYEHGSGTIREVSRKLGVHRREVRKALSSAIPAARKVPEREHPKLAPAIPFINAILEADRKAPRKQRHTAHRMWMRMQREMPEVAVAESTIRRPCLALSSTRRRCLFELIEHNAHDRGSIALTNKLNGLFGFPDVGRGRVVMARARFALRTAVAVAVWSRLGGVSQMTISGFEMLSGLWP